MKGKLTCVNMIMALQTGSFNIIAMKIEGGNSRILPLSGSSLVCFWTYNYNTISKMRNI